MEYYTVGRTRSWEREIVPRGVLADESIGPLPIGSTVIMRLSIELATGASITLVYAPTNVNELYCTTVPRSVSTVAPPQKL